ncbi:Phage integrase family [Budvicia aquatica]|uniref:Phage integrase family n=1 Tax=Budvicia aquatica TaxID=82979 RepID=A0A484ZV04_9GAMM|nr:Phage integrase family [Budvicia aquatica]
MGKVSPLNHDAIAIFKSIPQDSEYIFPDNGRIRNNINRWDFARALRLSGITNFRFHDLLHTWASWHVQNGTPLMVLKEMGGMGKAGDGE